MLDEAGCGTVWRVEEGFIGCLRVYGVFVGGSGWKGAEKGSGIRWDGLAADGEWNGT